MKLLPILLLICAVSCKPSKQAITDYRFFEKNLDSLQNVVLDLKEPVIQKHDLLSINVSSATLNQEQAEVFNLMTASTTGGATVQGYLVDYSGNISMPILGDIKAEGLTKSQLNEILLKKLEPYVKSPVVNIRFQSFRILMMGEGNIKGWISFPNEKATVVDAIGQAGGITEQGLRTNILLIRQQPGGQMETHRLDLNDALIFKSPYFQLQQNDILYVMPNDSKLIQYQRSNSPFFRDLPVYMALITSILAFATLIVALVQ